MKKERKSVLHGCHVACRALPALALICPAAAQAYVGPGAGLTAIGTMIALTLALVLALVGFVWYPIKRLRRKREVGRHDHDLGDPAQARPGDTTLPRRGEPTQERK